MLTPEQAAVAGDALVMGERAGRAPRAAPDAPERASSPWGSSLPWRDAWPLLGCVLVTWAYTSCASLLGGLAGSAETDLANTWVDRLPGWQGLVGLAWALLLAWWRPGLLAATSALMAAGMTAALLYPLLDGVRPALVGSLLVSTAVPALLCALTASMAWRRRRGALPPPLAELRAREVELHHPGVLSSRERLEALLHPEFHEIGRSGRAYDRQTVIDHLVAAGPQATTESGDFQAAWLGPGLALLTYRSAQRQPDGTLALHTLRSSVWALHAGRWRLRYHQGTPAAVGW